MKIILKLFIANIYCINEQIFSQTNSEVEMLNNELQSHQIFFLPLPLTSKFCLSLNNNFKNKQKRNEDIFRDELKKNSKEIHLALYDLLNKDSKEKLNKLFVEEIHQNFSILGELHRISQELIQHFDENPFGEQIRRLNRLYFDKITVYYEYKPYFCENLETVQQEKNIGSKYFQEITNIRNLINSKIPVISFERFLFFIKNNFIHPFKIFLGYSVPKKVVKIIPQFSKYTVFNLEFIESLYKNMTTDIERIFLSWIEVFYLDPKLNYIIEQISNNICILNELYQEKLNFQNSWKQHNENWPLFYRETLENTRKHLPDIDFLLLLIEKVSNQVILDENQNFVISEINSNIKKAKCLLWYFFMDSNKIDDICTALINIATKNYTTENMMNIELLKKKLESKKESLKNGEMYLLEDQEFDKQLEEFNPLKEKTKNIHFNGLCCVLENLFYLQVLHENDVKYNKKMALCRVLCTSKITTVENFEILKKGLPSASKDFLIFYKLFFNVVKIEEFD